MKRIFAFFKGMMVLAIVACVMYTTYTVHQMRADMDAQLSEISSDVSHVTWEQEEISERIGYIADDAAELVRRDLYDPITDIASVVWSVHSEVESARSDIWAACD